MTKLTALLPVVVALGLSSPAFASLSCTGGTLFSETGSSGGQQENGEACVTIGTGNTISVVLQNDDTIVTNVPSLLDGFTFTFSGATTIALATSNAVVVPSDFLQCTNGPSGVCSATTTFTDVKAGTTETSPFEYGVPSTNEVEAGDGSFHPAGVIGTLASTDPSSPGTEKIGDDPHNDYLLGDVTFNLTYTGPTITLSDITDMTFLWGTSGTPQDAGPGGTPQSNAPEPTSIVLLGTCLALVGKLMKSRLNA